MTALRHHIALALTLVLVLTGQSMALARGATDASGQMVICTGTGPVVVHVDENGDPTSPPHLCPDCVMQVLAAAATPDASTLLHAGGWAALAPAEPAAILPTRAATLPRARAPPENV